MVPARRRAVPGGQSDTRADPPLSLADLADPRVLRVVLEDPCFVIVHRCTPPVCTARASAHPCSGSSPRQASRSRPAQEQYNRMVVHTVECLRRLDRGCTALRRLPPPKPHASRPEERVVDALLAEAHAHAALDREVIEVERIVGYTLPLFRAARSPVRRAGCQRSGRRHRANGSSPSRVAGHRPSFGAANGSSSSAVTSSATGAASGAGAKGSTSPP